jgi:hypothetical protein
MAEIVLALLPLALLVCSLLLGHYPGCDTIVRLSARFAPRGRSRAARKPFLPKAPRLRGPSGGLLIALSIAQRPPPLVS